MLGVTLLVVVLLIRICYVTRSGTVFVGNHGPAKSRPITCRPDPPFG